MESLTTNLFFAIEVIKSFCLPFVASFVPITYFVPINHDVEMVKTAFSFSITLLVMERQSLACNSAVVSCPDGSFSAVVS